MSSRLDATEVRALLSAALRARLQPAGWEMLETEDDGHRLAAFRHPLGEDFAATSDLWLASSLPDRPPVLVTNVLAITSQRAWRRSSSNERSRLPSSTPVLRRYWKSFPTVTVTRMART